MGELRELAFAMLARIEAMRGDGPASLEAPRRGMAIVEHLGGALEEGEGLVRLVHAEALYAAGHHAAARGAITAARRRLLDPAARIGDPDLRASFLERVEEHARTLALAAEWECSEPT